MLKRHQNQLIQMPSSVKKAKKSAKTRNAQDLRSSASISSISLPAESEESKLRYSQRNSSKGLTYIGEK